MKNTTGQCHCGAVKFEIQGPVTHIDACHCNTCQALNAGPYMGADVQSGVTLLKSEALKWYASSEWAKRGFCSACGASLFYKLNEAEFWSVSSGALDLPAGVELSKEYFIDEKPDFYAFDGTRPRLTGEEVFASFQEGQEQTGQNND